MPLHMRLALTLIAFGVTGFATATIVPRQPMAAAGSAIGIAAGGDLTCRRVVKVGPLGFGARCVTAIRAAELASQN